MPIFSFTKTYDDGSALFELDLDNLRNSIQTAINTTKLDYQNFQAGSIGADSFEDGGIFAQSGTVVNYTATAAPTGWLNCNGQSVNVADYPDLFTAIGYTYGGAGLTFNVPNLQQRLAVGKTDMGGASAASRITDIVSGLNTLILGDTGGGETLPAHTHSGADLTGASGGSHSHSHSGTHVHNLLLNAYTAFTPSANVTLRVQSPNNADHNGTAFNPAAYVAETTTTGVTVGAGTGTHDHTLSGTFGVNDNTSGTSNGVVQPVIVLNKIIKT